MKTCTKCHITKPADAFNKKKSSRDGYRTYCRICQTEAGRRYHQENLDKERARSAVKNSSPQALVWKKKWRDANQENFSENQRRRRALKHNNGAMDKIDSRLLWMRDCGVCGLCEERIDITRKFPDQMSISVDHVIALTKGGPHTWANVQAAHFGCNLSKGNR